MDELKVELSLQVQRRKMLVHLLENTAGVTWSIVFCCCPCFVSLQVLIVDTYSRRSEGRGRQMESSIAFR